MACSHSIADKFSKRQPPPPLVASVLTSFTSSLRTAAPSRQNVVIRRPTTCPSTHGPRTGKKRLALWPYAPSTAPTGSAARPRFERLSACAHGAAPPARDKSVHSRPFGARVSHAAGSGLGPGTYPSMPGPARARDARGTAKVPGGGLPEVRGSRGTNVRVVRGDVVARAVRVAELERPRRAGLPQVEREGLHRFLEDGPDSKAICELERRVLRGGAIYGSGGLQCKNESGAKREQRDGTRALHRRLHDC
jgi:hypothetical protein